ncbi:MAG: hypothetical protein FH753_14790 [Firmicutes bacterium]|nr:hypothetical protein [Bacillota bacterium]
MKGYLLLSNGIILNGKVIGDIKNILGISELTDDGVKINCQATNKSAIVTNKPNNKGDFLISDENFKHFKKVINDNESLQCKIVTDNLALDFHIYDLKTNIINF